MAVKIVIEPIFEADLEDCSFGFRPKINQQNSSLYFLCNGGVLRFVDAPSRFCISRVYSRL